MRLLTTRNTKILKGRDKGYMIFGMHLSPGRVCARATPGCLKACLNTAGQGCYRNVQDARARKTQFFWDNTAAFLSQLRDEIAKMAKRAERKGFIPAFRLNLTSDIPWEVYGIVQEFPLLQFYDYTKYAERHPPDNYHLTFSRGETLQNQLDAKKWLHMGRNVAVVFKDDNFPQTYWGYPVHSGEHNDLRFLDPYGIVGLKAKGRAKRDDTGFVVQP